MYRKPNTGVVVMETAKDRGRFDAPISLNRARDRCIFTQGQGSVGHVSLSLPNTDERAILTCESKIRDVSCFDRPKLHRHQNSTGNCRRLRVLRSRLNDEERLCRARLQSHSRT